MSGARGKTQYTYNICKVLYKYSVCTDTYSVYSKTKCVGVPDYKLCFILHIIIYINILYTAYYKLHLQSKP